MRWMHTLLSFRRVTETLRRREALPAARGSQFSEGRNVFGWMWEINGEMRFWRIISRGVALSSGFREWVRALSFSKETTALRGAFTTAWWRVTGSRADRFYRTYRIALLPFLLQVGIRHCRWSSGRIPPIFLCEGAMMGSSCMLETLPCRRSLPDGGICAPWPWGKLPAASRDVCCRRIDRSTARARKWLIRRFL